MNVWNASSAGKSAALPGMPAQNSVGQSVVLWLLGGDASGAQAQEAAFERDLKRRRKKRRKGLGL